MTKTDGFRQRWKHLARLQLQQCTTCLAVILGGFPGGVWRRAKRKALQVSTGSWSSKGSWGITGILLLVELFVFLLGEAEDISQGDQGISEHGGLPWQPSSMKLLPLHVLTDHSLVEASGFLLLAMSSSHFISCL